MVGRAPRLLLSLAALLLVVGALMHGSAFDGVATTVAESGLPPFLVGGFSVLWLADSAVQLLIAAVFGLVAARPPAATRPVIVLLALVPGVTAGLLYRYVGIFVGAHILLAAAVLALAAALGWTAARDTGR
jgi:hypothetical protein